MQTLKSKVFVLALALAASSLLAAAQGAPSEQASPPGPPPSNQNQAQAHEDGQKPLHRRHRRRRHRRHHRRHRRPPLAMMLRNPAFRERLGITPEQAARIEAQQSAFMKTMIRDRAEVQVKRLELAEVFAAEKPDRALLEKKLRELDEAQFAMRKAALDHRLFMQETLTPEQRNKLREMARAFQMRRMRNGWEGPGRMRRRGPGPEPSPGPPGT